MPIKTEPFLDGKFGWNYGENNWNDGVDENILKMSFMLNKNIDGVVASLPVSPMNGTAYFLTTDNTLNARVDGAWRQFTTPLGFILRDKASGARYEFNGSALIDSLDLADKTKLDAIALGATVNSADATLLARANHTGVQAISTVTGLQTALDLKATIASPTFTGTVTVPTPTTLDNSTKPATTAYVQAQGYLTSASAGLVTSVAGRAGDVVLVKADAGLANVDNTADASKPVSTAQQTALNLKANLASPTFTGTVVLPSTTSIGNVSNTELSYLDGVSSSIQMQIDSITGVSGGYAPINNPTFTGTVGGITKAMVGLSNVDNTSDVSKPVSTATQTALNLKANVANPLFTGKITGDFSNATEASKVAFQTSTANSDTTLVVLPSGTATTSSSTVYNNSTPTNAARVSLVATATETQLKSDITGTGAYLPLNILTGGSARVTISAAGVVTLPASTIIGSVDATEISYLNGVTSGLQTQLNNKAGFIDPIFTGNVIIDAAAGQTSLYLRQAGVNNGRVWAGGGGGTDVNISSGRFIGMFPTNDFIVGYSGITKFSVASTGVVSASDASGLENLNATNVALGTLSAARLPYTFSSSTGASTGVLRDASGDIHGNTLNGTGLNIIGVTPNTINRDTNNLVATMSGYTSYQDSSAAEVGWLGYNTGNGEFGINNGVRNIRFSSPVVTNSTLNTTGAIVGSANITSGGTVYSSGAGGFACTSYALNARNPIWFIGNSPAYGLSYFQGTSGISGDVLGIHFGTATAAGSPFQFNAAGKLIVSSDITSTGGVFYGNGAGLSTLNATNIVSGTVAAARLPFSYTSANTNNAVVQRDGSGSFNATTITATSFVGSGSQLTSLEGSQITSGTIATARLPFTLSSANTNSTVVQRDTVGSFQANVVTATHVGDGAGLTGLNGSSIATGTVASARLPSGTTSVAGILQVIDSVSSTSITAAASPNSVRDVYLTADAANTLANTAVQKAAPAQKFQSLGSVSGAVTITAASGMHVMATTTGTTTWTFPSPSSTEVHALTLELTDGGNFTQNFPSGTRWAGGTQPSLTAAGTDILVFTKAGTNNWRGYLSSKDSK